MKLWRSTSAKVGACGASSPPAQSKNGTKVHQAGENGLRGAAGHAAEAPRQLAAARPHTYQTVSPNYEETTKPPRWRKTPRRAGGSGPQRRRSRGARSRTGLPLVLPRPGPAQPLRRSWQARAALHAGGAASKTWPTLWRTAWPADRPAHRAARHRQDAPARTIVTKLRERLIKQDSQRRAEPGRRRKTADHWVRKYVRRASVQRLDGCWWKRSRSSTWTCGRTLRACPEPRRAVPAGGRLPSIRPCWTHGPAHPSTSRCDTAS